MSEKKKASAADLLVGSDKPKKHVIETDVGELTVWIRQMSWLERQQAFGEFIDLRPDPTTGQIDTRIDFAGYWRFAITSCVERTDPSLTTDQLLNLRADVGTQLQQYLPKITELAQVMDIDNVGPDSPLGSE